MTRPALRATPWLAAFLALSWVTGCGTILHGGTQRVLISSTPPGARVQIDGNEYPDTPVTAVLARRSDHVVTVTPADGEPVVVRLDRRFSIPVAIVDAGFLVIDYLYLGLPVLAVDAYTGSLFRLTPDRVQVGPKFPPQKTAELTQPQ